MAVLDRNLINKFVAATDDSDQKPAINTFYATTVINNSGSFVQIDGSNVLTPVVVSTDMQHGDRVLVTIEDHVARIASNITSPASGRGATDLNAQINGLPLYWDKEPFSTTTENDYPILVNGVQLVDDEDNLLYWDVSHYYESGEYVVPEASVVVSNYEVLNNLDSGDPIFSSNIVGLLDSKADAETTNSNIQSISVIIQSVQSDLIGTAENLQQEIDSNKIDIDERTERIEQDIKTHSDIFERFEGRLYVGDDVIVGDQNKSNVQITDTSINMRNAATTLAWMTDDVLNIDTADITKLRLGRFILEETSTNTLVLKERANGS